MPPKSPKPRGNKTRAQSAGKRISEGASDSRKRLLQAAYLEFSGEGLRGARVDVIARRARINKQLIYYHFGDKDSLYLAVLEQAYSEIRQREENLNLADDEPAAAMVKLIGFTFDYVAEHREFVRLLINENILEARFVRRSRLIRETSSPILDLLKDTLRRGATTSIFRRGVDPLQLYISMAALCFFYIGNIHTLSALFGRDFNGASLMRERRKHVTDLIMRYLRPDEDKAPRLKRKRVVSRRQRALGTLAV